MQIKNRTPRTEMEYDIILSKMGELLTEIAKSLDAQEFWVDRTMTQYARLSSRVEFTEGEVDFSPVHAADSPAVIREKFESYLDSAALETVELALTMLLAHDAPSELATAPEVPVSEKKS